jgi:hypothetical protein
VGLEETVARLTPIIANVPIGATGALLLVSRLDAHHGRYAVVAERMRKELAGPVPLHPYFAIGVRLGYAEALHHVGRPAEARTMLAEARDLLLANEARFTDPELRRLYIDGVPHHRLLLEMAKAWDV